MTAAAENIELSLDPRLAELGIAVSFVFATGRLMPNAAGTAARQWCTAQSELRRDGDLGSICERDFVRGYRDLHQSIHVNDRDLVPSPESLIRTMMTAGTLRSIGPVVDTYNRISLSRLISIGGHDRSKLDERVSLRINRGGERFRPLGRKKKMDLPANEYAYATDNDRIICRLECKQSNDTKITEATDRWLFIIQGNKNIPEPKIVATQDTLIEQLATSVISSMRCDAALLNRHRLHTRLAIGD